MRDIKLDSTAWIDLVFTGKNKSYGAYKLRELSTKRHLLAFACTVLIAALIAILPTLIESVKPKAKEEPVSIVEVTQLADLELEKKIEEKNIIQQQEAPPPPPLKATIQYTAPVITDAADVTDENEMKSQDDLLAVKTQISIATVEGDDSEDAVDIADLQQHQVVVEAKEEAPHRFVEQMPQFPGGDTELMKYLGSNIQYPVIAAESGIQGRVVVQFVVSATGDITNVEVIQKLDPSCDKEAVRVIKSMPKWIPGMQNGRAVPVYFTVPVQFRLQ